MPHPGRCLAHVNTSFQKQVTSTVNAGSPGAATLMVYFVSHGTYCTITKRKGNQKWKKKWEEGKMERETRSRNKATGTWVSSVGWRGPE